MEKIDYSKYSLNELHEAYESIDRERFPERVREIEHAFKVRSLTMQSWAENHTQRYPSSFNLAAMLIINFCVLVCAAWLCIKVYVYDMVVDDFELYLLPFYCAALIGSCIYYVRYRKIYQSDFLLIEQGNVSFSEKGEITKIHWPDVEKVVFKRPHKGAKYFEFYLNGPVRIYQAVHILRPVKYAIEETLLEELLIARTEALSIPYEDKTEIWRALA